MAQYEAPLMQKPKTSKKITTKNANPLQSGILKFLSLYQPKAVELFAGSNALPKRYTRYGTLLLLGPTFAIHSQDWSDIYTSLDEAESERLYECILGQFSDGFVTHIAINAPISQTTEATHDENGTKAENVMRSPNGLIPLYGNFGPSRLAGEMTEHDNKVELQPDPQDFDAAYWVQTIQLQNITQVWAPRWTMFSRGNISEKARILQDGSNNSPFPGLSEGELTQKLDQVDVVDFYVGIGYFAFCYLTRGVRRVWGWDINGWSIEGLRRGCVKNKWAVKVVKVDDNGQLEGEGGVDGLVDCIEKTENTSGPIRLIAFWGDNRWASKVMDQISKAFVTRSVSQKLNIRHCNLGLLPSSENSWEGALKVLSSHQSSWLHVHENTEIIAIDNKKDEILRELNILATAQGKIDWSFECEHIEKVKTYAPGIMHCVFDIKLQPPI